jgi:hypothetical protein
MTYHQSFRFKLLIYLALFNTLIFANDDLFELSLEELMNVKLSSGATLLST